MIGIGLGNILYKEILTKEDIKELKSNKPIEVSPQRDHQLQRDWKVLGKVLLLCILFYGAYIVSSEVFSPPSRRLCNMSFVLYHAACVLAGTSMCILMDLIHS
jgi:hypothetical protein